jgi:hypothetical protein
MEGYNEYDDYGMDSAEGGKEYEMMIDAQVRAIIEACPCETAGTIEAADALLSGSCRSCGWNA